MKDIKLVLQELEKHKERLLYSKEKIEKWGKLSEDTLKHAEKVETIDSFIFRFSKMQDSMGEKLFPLTLEFLGEEIRNKPFIDILNKLEKLEILESAAEWKKLRELRNLLTHTYPWETEELIENITVALFYSERLVEIYERFKNYLKAHGLE
ncbi:hypothetical protein GFV12_06625 [Desulfurobacterium thermolithotrophum]|uniref:hypothetical protein n=1 Tax=Desulfurobacterium thermolithotrophum TaxID=64160 RepID=UPI0019547CDD|nr:hypothetical protein [Desulfurobacterium thermolithotrophum]